MIDIEKIYKNISEYDITEKNALNHLFQGDKNDISHFYFRSMLLQLLKNSEHLDKIIRLYYKMEKGSLSDNNYNVNINGRLERKNEYDILQESKQRLFEVYSKFERGDYEELKKILYWAKTMKSQLSTAAPYEGDFDKSIITPIKELDALKLQEDSLREKISECINQDDKNKKEMTESKALTITRKKKSKENGLIISKVQHKHFLLLFYIIEKIRHKKDNKKLEQELKEVENAIEKKIQEVRQSFISLGIENLYDEVYSRYQYYNKETSMYSITHELGELDSFLPSFFNDLFVCSKIIQNQINVLEKMKEGATLSEVCDTIINGLNQYNKQFEIGKRNYKIRSGSFLYKAASVSELQSEFNKLDKEFKEIMNEKDDEKFVRKCADFHFNFLKVHPFSDGNGRTARILLTTLLASRNIFFPSLYTEYSGKEEFYIHSDEALKGNYQAIENELIHRLGHFYPMILPGTDNRKKSVAEELEITD